MDTNNQQPETTPAKQSRGWGKRIAIGGVALLALGGVGVATALSQGFGGYGHGGGFGMDERMQHGMMGGRMEPGDKGGRMQHAGGRGMGFGERGMERMLDQIDATPEQTQKLKAIMDGARGEIMPLAEEFRGTRDDIAALLAAPTIDRAAAEKLRAERVAKIDEASRKLTTAVLDAAEVLTPEQRTELVDHFKEHRGPGRW